MRAMKSLLPLILLAFAWQPATAREVPANHWVATWSASPQRAGAPIQLQAQTLRQIVHTSLGGSAVRVRISNAYGTTGLVIGAAHVALSAGGASIVGGSDRTLTFGGLPTITIPAGALAVSDVVPLEVPALGDLSVSFYLPDAVAEASGIMLLEEAFLVAALRTADEADGPAPRPGQHDVRDSLIIIGQLALGQLALRKDDAVTIADCDAAVRVRGRHSRGGRRDLKHDRFGLLVLAQTQIA